LRSAPASSGICASLPDVSGHRCIRGHGEGAAQRQAGAGGAHSPGTAVTVTKEPLAKLLPDGLLLTSPLPLVFVTSPYLAGAGGATLPLNVAVTAASALIVNLHVSDVPVQPPVHPVKVAPDAGVAVNVTSVPCRKVVPPGLALAVPVPQVLSIGALHTIQTGSPLTFSMGTDIALNSTGQKSLQHAQLVSGLTYDNIAIDRPGSKCLYQSLFQYGGIRSYRAIAQRNLRQCRA
jgi:hypothetical protein